MVGYGGETGSASRGAVSRVEAEAVTVENHTINTTVGRVLLNQAFPPIVPFVNGLLKKKGLTQLVAYCHLKFGNEPTVEMLDSIKETGFLYATKAGISIGIDDMVIPEQKGKLISEAMEEVVRVQQQYLDGAITNGERYNKVIAVWSVVTDAVSEAMFIEHATPGGEHEVDSVDSSKEAAVTCCYLLRRH